MNELFQKFKKEVTRRRTTTLSTLSKFFPVVRLSVNDQALFAKRLSFLIGAGVPILESLEMLQRQADSKAKVRMYEKVIADVANGQFLSTSLSRFQNVFGDFAINIIKVGEASGILSQNLNYLADELAKKQTLKRKIISALIYPAIITFATVGLTGLLIIYIFPKILPIFQSLHIPLPFTTRVLIFVSDLIRDHGVLFLGLTVFFLVVFFLFKKISPRFAFFLDRFILRIPISGAIDRDYNLTNICRTLGLLLKSGTRVVEAVTITGDTTANLIYRKELYRVAEGVMQGQKLSTHLETRPDLFPIILTQMISIGETTGNLSNTLLYLSKMYEDDLDEATKHLSSSIEPILMILMGLIVGFVAISIITPIYQVTQNLH